MTDTLDLDQLTSKYPKTKPQTRKAKLPYSVFQAGGKVVDMSIPEDVSLEALSKALEGDYHRSPAHKLPFFDYVNTTEGMCIKPHADLKSLINSEHPPQLFFRAELTKRPGIHNILALVNRELIHISLASDAQLRLTRLTAVKSQNKTQYWIYGLSDLVEHHSRNKLTLTQVFRELTRMSRHVSE